MNKQAKEDNSDIKNNLINLLNCTTSAERKILLVCVDMLDAIDVQKTKSIKALMGTLHTCFVLAQVGDDGLVSPDTLIAIRKTITDVIEQVVENDQTLMQYKFF